MNETNQYFTVKQASVWASKYLGKEVTMSDISSLIRYGRVVKIDYNGSTKILKSDIEKYYKPIPKPFIKWVGGKSQLLKQFQKFYPLEFEAGKIKTYFEPFLGGGAFYFSFISKYKCQKAYLSDKNKDLILAYLVIQRKQADLIELLEKYQNIYDKTKQEHRYELYLSIRKKFNQHRCLINYEVLTDICLERAAQFIFLNKTCFNGLFRMNSKGKFNVPFGRYKTALICDKDNIANVSANLQNAEITYADYSRCYAKIDDNSFVYFDPPYRPISKTSSFTTYTGVEFDDVCQKELAAFFKKTYKEKGAKLMLSNSASSDNFFEKIYSGYNIYKVFANRYVNCNELKRDKINELLITNYKAV